MTPENVNSSDTLNAPVLRLVCLRPELIREITMYVTRFYDWKNQRTQEAKDAKTKYTGQIESNYFKDRRSSEFKFMSDFGLIHQNHEFHRLLVEAYHELTKLISLQDFDGGKRLSDKGVLLRVDSLFCR